MMKESKFFRIFFIVMLALKFLVCITMVMAFLLIWLPMSMRAGVDSNPLMASIVIGLLPGIIGSLIFSYKVLKRTIKKWHQWIFYAESLITLAISFGYFKTPMHDIALFFGSHGRFGCRRLHAYFFTDATVPLFLFVPPLVIGIIYFRFIGRKVQTADI